MNEFHYTSYAQEIIFGSGSVARLGEAVERFSWQRLMLCSTGSQRRNGHIAAIENVLGERLVARYESVAPHVPDDQVAEVSAIAYNSKIDALIGLGGGSPIGMVKAVSMAVEEKRSGRPARAAFPTEQPLVLRTTRTALRAKLPSPMPRSPQNSRSTTRNSHSTSLLR